MAHPLPAQQRILLIGRMSGGHSSAHSRASGNPEPSTPPANLPPRFRGVERLLLSALLPLLLLTAHKRSRALHRIGEPALLPLAEVALDRLVRVGEPEMD